VSTRRVAAVLLLLLAVLVSAAVACRVGVRTVATRGAASAPGPVDIGFAQSMRSHHDQAIVMTKILLDGGHTQLAGLARAIQTTQLIEIGEMKGWLLLWRKPLLPASTGMNWMLLGTTPPDASLTRYLSDCRNSPGGMPGLATRDELERLRQLDGDARDRLFLQLMSRHHEGGLPMAQFAARNAETAVVRTFAAEMAMQQMQEVATMALLRQRLH
jgi:uncharacterized protein (DUF305 family)